MKRRTFFGLGALGIATLFGGCKREEKVENFNISKRRKISLKLATSWPANFPIMGEGVEEFAKKVKEASGGEIEI
ncbi:MAG: C4-dicarboxylate ABC transporter, partial [Epsilonproteobacteria bacterium]|nr:C4-dicarboxylate ABC transporter [Campylobacterota bacterium]